MNFDPAEDNVVNVLHSQMKRGIRACLEHKCFGSAAILIYSGIDSMTYVSLPAGRDSVMRADFVRWANRYLSLCKSGDLSGDELYSARCGMLHTYGVASDMTRHGRCRQIGYVDHMLPPILFAPSISSDLVLVSTTALAESFFSGVDQFLIDIFSDKSFAPVAEERFNQMCRVSSI